MKSPTQCGGKAADCPPDFPGCNKESPAEGEKGKEEGEPENAGARKRIWVGIAGALDFMLMPSGTNLCHLDPTTNQPSNSVVYYCTNANGSDFPSRNDNMAQNNALMPGSAGNTSGGVVPGNARLVLSFDYALTKNVLLGARLGLVLFEYPGGSPSNLDASQSVNAAVKDGRATSLGRFNAEIRGTYVLGDDPLAHVGWAPLVFAGIGISEFDGHTSDTVRLGALSGNINIWRTDGPLYFALGGGARWALTDSIAATGAVRVNIAGFSNGVVWTVGPELGLQYGF